MLGKTPKKKWCLQSLKIYSTKYLLINVVILVYIAKLFIIPLPRGGTLIHLPLNMGWACW
jgi:hypothetical protein